MAKLFTHLQVSVDIQIQVVNLLQENCHMLYQPPCYQHPQIYPIYPPYSSVPAHCNDTASTSELWALKGRSLRSQQLRGGCMRVMCIMDYKQCKAMFIDFRC